MWAHSTECSRPFQTHLDFVQGARDVRVFQHNHRRRLQFRHNVEGQQRGAVIMPHHLQSHGRKRTKLGGVACKWRDQFLWWC